MIIIIITFTIVYCVGIAICSAILEHLKPGVSQDGLPLFWPIILIIILLFVVPYVITKKILKKYT